MASKAAFPFKRFVLFLSRSFPKRFRSPTSTQKKFITSQRSELLSNHTLIFNVEGALLKSSSFFPYFMVVAFEAGSLIRAFILFLLYPFISVLRQDMALKAMVFVSFVGLRNRNFRAGSAVLPKFYLENVGLEAFEVLSKGKKKVGVSDFPQVMIESFLRDYLDFDVVAGRELKVCHGYFLGLMEERKKVVLGNISEDDNQSRNIVGITCSNQYFYFDPRWFSQCKEIHLVKEGYRRSWHLLPRDKYPKPLVFHDGRLAFRATALSTLAMFMWLPLALPISIFRCFVAFAIPFNVGIPILAFTGMRLKLTKPNAFLMSEEKNYSKGRGGGGLLYVCNHRTLLDPLFLCFGLKKPLTAVTYSISRISEIISPIKTISLTRDRDQDSMIMKKMLNHGDLVVCPEGTTCREPYLLRFSPLFTELNANIVPVAMDCHVTMFYGTTAGGFKCLDPFFFLMNPCPSYSIQFRDNLSGLSSSDCQDDSRTKYDVANYVQSELGKALGFTCTKLTRKDKYMILAGSDGIVSSGNKA